MEGTQDIKKELVGISKNAVVEKFSSLSSNMKLAIICVVIIIIILILYKLGKLDEYLPENIRCKKLIDSSDEKSAESESTEKSSKKSGKKSSKKSKKDTTEESTPAKEECVDETEAEIDELITKIGDNQK